MNAVGQRHMFWAPARPPMLTNGRFQTTPLRHSGRPVTLGGGLFLSQNAPNRLSGVSVGAIIGRIQIHPGVQAYLEKIKGPPGPRSSNFLTNVADVFFADKPPPNFPPMTEAERQILTQVSQNPTDEELKDLATIDKVFNQEFERQGYTTTMDVCYLTSVEPFRVHMALNYYRGKGRGRFLYTPPKTEATKHEPPGNPQEVFSNQKEIKDPGFPRLIYYLVPIDLGLFNQKDEIPEPKPDTSFAHNGFYCTDRDSVGLDIPVASRFGIDPTKPWGQVSQAVENAQIILDVHSAFPFPPPIDTEPYLFWKFLAADLPKIANIPARVDAEAVRAWMTLATLANYNDISKQIQEEAAAAARRARRNAWLTFGITLIFSLLVPFIAPAIIAAAVTLIKIAITTVIDIKTRQEAAKQLADASKMFAEDAPAFAKEVQKTADLMDSETAQLQASKPLTPDMQAAVNDIAQGVPSTPTGTYVVGGVAAAGVIAAIIALVK